MDTADTTSLRCARCRLALRLHTTQLKLDRCPRCFLEDAITVPLHTDLPPGLVGEGDSAPPARTTFGSLVTTTSRDADGLVVSLYGDLDITSAGCLEQALRRARATGLRKLVVDLSGLEFIDGNGLQVLLRARSHALANGHSLSLLRGQRNVQRIFELTGTLHLFSFDD